MRMLECDGLAVHRVRRARSTWTSAPTTAEPTWDARTALLVPIRQDLTGIRL